MGDVHSLDKGLIYRALRDPTKAAHRYALLRLMSQALGLREETGNQEDTEQLLKEAEVNYKQIICSFSF